MTFDFTSLLNDLKALEAEVTSTVAAVEAKGQGGAGQVSGVVASVVQSVVVDVASVLSALKGKL